MKHITIPITLFLSMSLGSLAQNLVLSTGTASNASENQTVNINSVRHDAFFIITDEKTNNHYRANDMTHMYTTAPTKIYAVHDSNESPDNSPWFTLSGVQLSHEPMQKGIYIHNGKKEVVR